MSHYQALQKTCAYVAARARVRGYASGAAAPTSQYSQFASSAQTSSLSSGAPAAGAPYPPANGSQEQFIGSLATVRATGVVHRAPRAIKFQPAAPAAGALGGDVASTGFVSTTTAIPVSWEKGDRDADYVSFIMRVPGIGRGNSLNYLKVSSYERLSVQYVMSKINEGDAVMVEGPLDVSSWVDKETNHRERMFGVRLTRLGSNIAKLDSIQNACQMRTSEALSGEQGMRL